MRMATGLAVIAVGAILAFAVNGHPSFLNIQVAGWVIMLTGVAGIVIPRRGYGWVRRQLRLQQVSGRRSQRPGRYPQYVALTQGTESPPDTASVPADPWGPAAPGAVSDDTDPMISEDFTEETVTDEVTDQ